MKRLILMRHAKSDWSGHALSDHDRVLNKRGRASAAALGDWMRAEGVQPDEVLISSSARTRETFERLDLAAETTANFTKDLYLASEDQIMTVIQRAHGNCVLIVGHNPGIAMCAEKIVAAAPAHPQFHLYPTGATLVADLEIDNWSDARWENAIARHFIVPRDL
jgi:phosphohistidine phosphatase